MAKKKVSNDMLINVLLDRSGSMALLAKEVISHFNAYIDEQKKEPGNTTVSLVLFDDQYEEVYIGKDVREIEPLTEETYFTRGMTAYLDAIGKFIKTVDGIKNKPEKIIFLVNTDGFENASHEYNWEQIKALVTEKTKKNDWQFVFITAGLDKVAVQNVASMSGFDPSNTMVASATPQGSWGTFSNFSGYSRAYRRSAGGQSVTVADVAIENDDVEMVTSKAKKKKTTVKVTTTGR